MEQGLGTSGSLKETRCGELGSSCPSVRIVLGGVIVCELVGDLVEFVLARYSASRVQGTQSRSMLCRVETGVDAGGKVPTSGELG